jgi:nitroreductase
VVEVPHARREPAAGAQSVDPSTGRGREWSNGAFEQDGEIQTPDEEVAAIAEKVFAGGEATLEESNNLPLTCSDRMRRRRERRKSGARGRKHYRPNLARHFVKGRGLMLLIRLELSDPFARGLEYTSTWIT